MEVVFKKGKCIKDKSYNFRVISRTQDLTSPDSPRQLTMNQKTFHISMESSGSLVLYGVGIALKAIFQQKLCRDLHPKVRICRKSENSYCLSDSPIFLLVEGNLLRVQTLAFELYKQRPLAIVLASTLHTKQTHKTDSQRPLYIEFRSQGFRLWQVSSIQ